MEIMTLYKTTKEYLLKLNNFLSNAQKKIFFGIIMIFLCILIILIKNLSKNGAIKIQYWNNKILNQKTKNENEKWDEQANNLKKFIKKKIEKGKIVEANFKEENIKSEDYLREYKVMGARKCFLGQWKNQINYSWNVVRANIKDKNYAIDSSTQGNFSYFPTLLEKISEQEKNQANNKTINWGNLILGGVKIVKIKKNSHDPETKFEVILKTQAFLESIKTNAIFNSDSQLTLSLLSSVSEIKKINDLENSVLMDPLLSAVNEIFSLKSGSNISQKLSLFKRINVYNQFEDIENIIDNALKKKSTIFRKKKKKNFKRRKTMNSLIQNKKRCGYSICKIKNNKKNIEKKIRNRSPFIVRQKKFIRFLNRNKKKIVKKTKKISDSPLYIKKIKYSSNKLKKLKIKKIRIPKPNQRLKNIRFKYHFKLISKLKRFRNVSKISVKRTGLKRKKIRMDSNVNVSFKTLVCQRKTKNRLKFLTTIKKLKKKTKKLTKRPRKKLQRKKKKLMRWPLPRFKKYKKIFKFRKCFPFRHNSFWKIEKKLLTSKNRKEKIKLRINFDQIEDCGKKFFVFKSPKFFKNNSRSEFLNSKKKFSLNRKKTKYSRLIFLKEAVRLNHAKSLNRIGNLYFKGKLVPRSFSEASKYFIKAAKLGKVNSLFKLGNLYFEGKGVPRNRKMSFLFYSSAAKRGHRKSLYNCVYLLQKGIGIKKDPMRALNLLKKDTILKKRKKKTRTKRSKRSKKPKYLKIFRQFIRHPNETELFKCLMNSLFFDRFSFLTGIMIKKAGCPALALNYFVKCFFNGSFNSLMSLTETLAENRQLFLSNENAKLLKGYYPLEISEIFNQNIIEKKGFYFSFVFISNSIIYKLRNFFVLKVFFFYDNEKMKFFFYFLKSGKNFNFFFIFLFFYFLIPSIIEKKNMQKILECYDQMSTYCENLLEEFKKKIIWFNSKLSALIENFLSLIEKIYKVPEDIINYFKRWRKKQIKLIKYVLMRALF